jgi:hypothetical protein
VLDRVGAVFFNAGGQGFWFSCAARSDFAPGNSNAGGTRGFGNNLEPQLQAAFPRYVLGQKLLVQIVPDKVVRLAVRSLGNGSGSHIEVLLAIGRINVPALHHLVNPAAESLVSYRNRAALSL